VASVFQSNEQCPAYIYVGGFTGNQDFLPHFDRSIRELLAVVWIQRNGERGPRHFRLLDLGDTIYLVWRNGPISLRNC
jgi:hypothetical protein